MKLLQWGIVTAVLAIAIAAIAMAAYIAPKDPLETADAIVAVSGGDTRARTLEAVRLYKDKWAPRLIFSGAALDPEAPSNAAAMRQIAIGEGIPPEVITLDEYSHTTRQNADEVAYIIEALNYKTIILVTSPYHQRRTYMEFRYRLGEKIDIINHSAPDNYWDKKTWWKSGQGWYLTLSEGTKALLAGIRY